MAISVAMAVYNGEQFIAKQIDSILPQLNNTDELVISINPSTDRTEEIIYKYHKRDNRVKPYKCTEMGIIPNFENAIIHCENEIIFLSDQDDIWIHNKIELQAKYFDNPSIGGVCHTCKYIDSNGELTRKQPGKIKNGEIKNWKILVKNPIQGSTLAFRREYKDLFLPFPKNIPMHDSWIGIIISSFSKMIIIDRDLILYRQHSNQVTSRKHGSLAQMLTDRINLLYSYLKRIIILKSA